MAVHVCNLKEMEILQKDSRLLACNPTTMASSYTFSWWFWFQWSGCPRAVSAIEAFPEQLTFSVMAMETISKQPALTAIPVEAASLVQEPPEFAPESAPVSETASVAPSAVKYLEVGMPAL